MGIEYLQNEVINQNLCCGCGACIGVCAKKAIKINSQSPYYPNVFFKDLCVNCKLCEKVCPGLGYGIYHSEDNNEKYNQHIGFYKDLYSGYSSHDKILENSASGGTVTEILCFLLDHKIVDKVTVVHNSNDIESGLTSYFFTNNKEEVIEGQKSKYVQVPICELLENIIQSQERVAVAGLPCHLAAFAKAEKLFPAARKNIILKIGLFCGYSYSRNCIKGLFNHMGINANDVKRILGWRYGGVPGNFSVELTNGAIRSIPFIEEHSIDVPFYSLFRCHVCPDWSASYADISVGDYGGWIRKNLIIVRTSRGEGILNDLSKSGALNISMLDLNSSWNATVLSFMNTAKKERTNLFIRTMVREKKKIPEWDIEYLKPKKVNLIVFSEYYRIFNELRSRVAFYENNPKKMLSEGNFFYLHFWDKKNVILTILRYYVQQFFKKEGN